MCVRALNAHYYYLNFIVYVNVCLSLFSPLREIVISRGALARADFPERVRDIQQYLKVCQPFSLSLPTFPVPSFSHNEIESLI